MIRVDYCMVLVVLVVVVMVVVVLVVVVVEWEMSTKLFRVLCFCSAVVASFYFFLFFFLFFSAGAPITKLVILTVTIMPRLALSWFKFHNYA